VFFRQLTLEILTGVLVLASGCASGPGPGASFEDRVAYELRRERKAFRKCYFKKPSASAGIFTASQAREPLPSGKIHVEFKVTANGRVDQLKLIESTLDRPDVDQCVMKHLRTLVLPTSSTPTGDEKSLVDYTFEFVGSADY